MCLFCLLFMFIIFISHFKPEAYSECEQHSNPGWGALPVVLPQ